MNDDELLHRRQTVSNILSAAGSQAHASFNSKNFTAQSKGMQDYVSNVDQCTESFIRAELNKAFPDDCVLGEETGGQLGVRTWIVDPIDGTSNFVRGMAPWCLSAALVFENRAVVGAVYDPMQNEMFSCHEGGGSTRNGTQLKVSAVSDIQKAILGISFNFQNSKDTVAKVVETLISNGTSFRMTGSGALSLAHCAAGRTDGFWEAFMMPWDAAAGLALVTEAGGCVCNYEANDGFARGNPVLATNSQFAKYFSQITNVPIELSHSLVGSRT